MHNLSDAEKAIILGSNANTIIPDNNSQDEPPETPPTQQQRITPQVNYGRTSLADIIIQNVNGVANGMFHGFTQFVHDPQALRQTIQTVIESQPHRTFADEVIARRHEVNNIGEVFPNWMTLEQHNGDVNVEDAFNDELFE